MMDFTNYIAFSLLMSFFILPAFTENVFNMR